MLNFKKVVVAFSVTAVLSSGAYIANEEYSKVALAIHLDDQSIGVKVKKGKVGDILSSQGIEINSFDRVEPGIDTQITKGETIKVFKARDIVIKDGDKEETRKTTYKKVGDILEELNITLGKDDKVSPSLDSEVQSVDTIKIIRVEKIEEKSTEEVKFTTVEEKTDTLFVGEKVVKTKGKNGTKEITKEIVKENGEKVSDSIVSEKVTEETVNEVVLVGTKEATAANVANAGYVPQPAPSNYSAPAYYAPQPAYSGGALANGNTAGATGSYAAQQMAARTGVSAQTWEYIIARESNGQVNAYNPSGASGLFQTMPGWGSTATVDDQINAAVRAYNAQGLGAWGM